MKSLIGLVFIAIVFVGCGTVSLPSPIQKSTIVPTEDCN